MPTAAPSFQTKRDLEDRLEDTDLVTNLFYNWECIVYLVLIPIMFVTGRLTFPVLFRVLGVKDFSLEKELIEKDNKAVAVSFAGYLGGIGLIMWGTMSDQFESSSTNLYTTVAWSFIGVVLLMLCNVVNEIIVIHQINNKKAISQDKNLAVGIFEGCAFIGSGLTVMAVVSGGVVSWGTAIASAGIQFGLCQAGFVMFARLYEVISPYSPQELICHAPLNPNEEMREVKADGEGKEDDDKDEVDKHGNVAVGISYGTMCIALALYMSNTVSKDESLAAWGMWFGIGVIISLVMRIWVDRRLIPGDVNKVVAEGVWSAAWIEGTVLMTIGFLSWTFIEYDPCYNRAHMKDTTELSYTERLTSTNLLEGVFQWYRLVFLFIIFLTVWFAKYAFAVPIYLQCRKLGVPFDLGLVFRRDDPARLEYERRLQVTTERTRTHHLPREFAETSIGRHSVMMHARVKHLEETVRQLCERVHVEVAPMSDRQATDTIHNVNSLPQSPRDHDATNEAKTSEEAKVAAPAGEDKFDYDKLFRVPPRLRNAVPRFLEDTAIAFSFSGFLVGIALVMRGPLSTVPDADDEAGLAVGYTAMWIGIGFALLSLSMYIQNRVILPERYTHRGMNCATALVQAGQFIAAGFIVGASVSGDGGESWADDFIVTAIYYVLNTIALLGCSAVYQVVTRYDDVEHLAHGNVAAGLSFASHLVACGIILSNPVMKDDSLVAWIAFSGSAFAVLHVMRVIIDKVVLVGSELDFEIAHDVNWGAALIEAVCLITTALCLTTFLRKYEVDFDRGLCVE